jgi:mannose-6-phosphate isomerase-like protein (cupin superfamily)
MVPAAGGRVDLREWPPDGETPPMTVLNQDALPFSRIARELVGAEHGAGVCLLFVDAQPGDGPSLHRHPYEEIFIIQEGTCTFHVDGEEFDAAAGDIVIAPAGAAHRFVATGDGPLKQIDIHVSASFSTEWLTG